MLQYFVASVSGTLDELRTRARAELSGRSPAKAAQSLIAALLLTHSREDDYGSCAALLGDALEQLGEARGALSVAWYLGDQQRATRLLGHVPPVDRGRTYGGWALLEPRSSAGHHRQAAQEFDSAGLLVRAAIHYEKAQDARMARSLWARLADRIDPRQDAYAAGLARFNVARTSGMLEDARGQREATVGAVHLLEEAADRFESTGLRERAFDCYHVLISIGELTGSFEHVLEGAVNATRILAEDNLRYHALRLHGHTLRLAQAQREFSAAASVAREMTDYARKQGLGRIASAGVLRQAELWQKVADATLTSGGPAQLAENALLASLLANAEAGRYSQVGLLYRKLSEVVSEASRREHYDRASRRYQGALDAQLEADALDERLGEHVGPPDVWHDDLVEWEHRGNPAEAAADVLLDPQESEDRITRRSALVARLAGLAVEAAAPNDVPRAQVVVAEQLAPIGLYQLLSPIEHLFQSPHETVRLAAIRALSRYFYKRTFVTLERALLDPHPPVVSEATETLERLRFDHAFEPLARIFRTAHSPNARLAALRALARIDVLDAAELMLSVLEHGSADERNASVTALKMARGGRFFELARSAYPQSSEGLRSTLKELLQSRGIAV